MSSTPVSKIYAPWLVTLNANRYGWTRLQETWQELGRPGDDINEKSEEVLECEIHLAPGLEPIRGYAFRDVVFVGDDRNLHPWPLKTRKVDPFFSIEPVGTAYHRTVSVQRPKAGGFSSWSRPMETVQAFDAYGARYGYGDGEVDHGIPWNYLRCRVTAGSISEEFDFRFKRPEAGRATLVEGGSARCSRDFFGLPLTWDLNLHGSGDRYSYDNGWLAVRSLLANFEIEQGKDALWREYLSRYSDRENLTKAVKSFETKKDIQPNLERLKQEDPTAWAFYVWLHEERTKQGVSNNSLLAAFLKARGSDYEALRSGLRETMDAVSTLEVGTDYQTKDADTRVFCLALPGAKDKNEEQRAKKEWNLRKGAREQAIGLGVDPKAHPKLLAAIEGLKIPLSLFHDPGDHQSLCNVEFDLWEKALKREGWDEVLFSIGKAASTRTTFEKKVTPYIAFLFRIEKYLDRHTGKGKKWRAMPKFVSSQWELEMDESENEQTTKRRSAMTPIPDNENRIVTVPYVAMAVSGVRTTYCYSLLYQVFEENTLDVESESPIVNDLEVKLNGRDDYGLMYFTLTGTGRNTGYPTFLIIFERRKSGTHVHFHRVHPSRSKDGKTVPACRLIEECYRYMAGNVRAEEIAGQQGDLLFVPSNEETDFSEAKGVREFESHAFTCPDGSEVMFLERQVKSIKNRLGFMKTTGPLHVDHPEHEPLRLPAGVYEVRRTKSYENNPSGQWVLTID